MRQLTPGLLAGISRQAASSRALFCFLPGGFESGRCTPARAGEASSVRPVPAHIDKHYMTNITDWHQHYRVPGPSRRASADLTLFLWLEQHGFCGHSSPGARNAPAEVPRRARIRRIESLTAAWPMLTLTKINIEPRVLAPKRIGKCCRKRRQSEGVLCRFPRLKFKQRFASWRPRRCAGDVAIRRRLHWPRGSTNVAVG
jgi:hypothetical protein